MDQREDRTYLRTQQYRDASNLRARGSLHERFSTNPRGWFGWVFDHFALTPAARVLELGCGTGWLWQANLARIPTGWQIVLTDFSPGMLDDARQALRAAPRPLQFVVADAQAIPFADASFDAIIANHMLHHVPDRARALAEIHRVLAPRGRLYAATNGPAHLQELDAPLHRFDAEMVWWDGVSQSFTLENGSEQMSRWFSAVTVMRYEDALRITELEPLVAYALSTRARSALSPEGVADLTRVLEEAMAPEGLLRVTKDSGLLIADRNDHGA